VGRLAFRVGIETPPGMAGPSVPDRELLDAGALVDAGGCIGSRRLVVYHADPDSPSEHSLSSDRVATAASQAEPDPARLR
jgi:hypothetical protein